MGILMEREPKGVRASNVKKDIEQNTTGLVSIDDLHIWVLAGGKNILVAHLTVTADTKPEDAHR